MIYNIMF